MQEAQAEQLLPDSLSGSESCSELSRAPKQLTRSVAGRSCLAATGCSAEGRREGDQLPPAPAPRAYAAARAAAGYRSPAALPPRRAAAGGGSY